MSVIARNLVKHISVLLPFLIRRRCLVLQVRLSLKRTLSAMKGANVPLKTYFKNACINNLITHAIADDNVLKFSIEYWGKLKRKDGSLIDEKVPAINIKEFFESEERIENIVDWVIAQHARKTHNKLVFGNDVR